MITKYGDYRLDWKYMVQFVSMLVNINENW
jgi:hypothetical protein